MRRQIAIFGVALVAGGLAAERADGDGLPVDGVDASRSGVVTETPDARYVTLPAGRETVVARVRRAGGRVLSSRLLQGAYTIPVVALDGTADGLSGDDETLVLIRPRPAFPRARTQFAVLRARDLKLRSAVTLQGDFSFDALSPDGATLYVIEYTSRRDPTRYRVRAYDLLRDRLRPDAIVDAREPDERMRGYPITRATSDDGRWAYTLYDGAGSHPFVHALDTELAEAFCIDLDPLQGRQDLYDLRLGLGGGDGELTVRGASGPVLVVDRSSFAVREPSPPASPAPLRADDASSSSPVIATAAATLLLAGAALIAARRRRSGGAVVMAVRDDAEPERGEAPHSRV